MRTQQHRFVAFGIALFDAARALLGQFVDPWIETFARLRDKRPAELFERKLKIPSVPNLLLEPGNFFTVGYRLSVALEQAQASSNVGTDAEDSSLRSCYGREKKATDRRSPRAEQEKSKFGEHIRQRCSR